MTPAPRRHRIAVVGPSPCERCVAACCKRSLSDYAVLLQGEAERRRFAAWSLTLPVRGEDGRVVHERVIPYRDDGGGGRCPFLGEGDLCDVYDDRPTSCRAFECTRHFDGQRGHSLFLRGNPAVASLLESL